MQKPLTAQDIGAADKQVGIAVGVIGAAISAWFIGALLFLLQYHAAVYR